MPEDTGFLRQKSRRVEKIDRNLGVLMEEMAETLKRQSDPEGVGLSAVQIGKLVRIFVLNRKYLRTGSEDEKRTKANQLVYYLNPEIISHSAEKTLGQELMNEKKQPFLEGCLSVPDLYGEVRRWTEIKIKAAEITEADLARANYDLPARVLREQKGLAARVIQHEIDHLNGILFTDHVVAEGGRIYRYQDEKMNEIEL